MKKYRIKQFGLLWWIEWIFIWAVGIAGLWLCICGFAAIPVSYADSEPVDIHAEIEQGCDVCDRPATKALDLQKEQERKKVEEQARIEEEKRLANLTIEERIIETCQSYGIRHDIPVAISKLETGHYKSTVCTQYNNVGGMMYGGQPIVYGSIEEGVEAFVSNLAEHYFAEGLTTVEAISVKYNPSDSVNWSIAVNQLL